jgi:hypothetical protein
MRNRNYLLGILLLVYIAIYASKMTAQEQTQEIMARLARIHEGPVDLMDQFMLAINADEEGALGAELD